jgi:hypothetical protein
LGSITGGMPGSASCGLEETLDGELAEAGVDSDSRAVEEHPARRARDRMTGREKLRVLQRMFVDC